MSWYVDLEFRVTQVYPTAALSHGSIGAVIKLHRASLLFGSEDFPGPAAVAQGALEAEKASGEKGEGSAVVRNGGLAEIRSRAAALASKDKRVGFPGTRPSVSQNPHGWFFPSHKVCACRGRGVLTHPPTHIYTHTHTFPTTRYAPADWLAERLCVRKVVLDLLLTPETKCVLELGSWLGKSTKFIRKCAPNAFIFCIDLWENDYVLADPHYTDEASETAAAGPQVAIDSLRWPAAAQQTALAWAESCATSFVVAADEAGRGKHRDPARRPDI